MFIKSESDEKRILPLVNSSTGCAINYQPYLHQTFSREYTLVKTTQKRNQVCHVTLAVISANNYFSIT